MLQLSDLSGYRNKVTKIQLGVDVQTSDFYFFYWDTQVKNSLETHYLWVRIYSDIFYFKYKVFKVTIR